MFLRLYEDATELVRANRTVTDGTRSRSLGGVLASDAYRVLALNRARETARSLKVPLVNHVLRVAQTALLGIEIGRDVRLGRGVWFVHSLGIIIGGNSVIGDRVRFYGSNTVGTVSGGYPVIEDDVVIGAGARILGPVRIGRGARIGANAVVLIDVPAGATAVGVPARVLPKDGAPSEAPAPATPEDFTDEQLLGELHRRRVQVELAPNRHPRPPKLAKVP